MPPDPGVLKNNPLEAGYLLQAIIIKQEVRLANPAAQKQGASNWPSSGHRAHTCACIAKPVQVGPTVAVPPLSRCLGSASALLIPSLASKEGLRATRPQAQGCHCCSHHTTLSLKTCCQVPGISSSWSPRVYLCLGVHSNRSTQVGACMSACPVRVWECPSVYVCAGAPVR